MKIPAIPDHFRVTKLTDITKPSIEIIIMISRILFFESFIIMLTLYMLV